MSVTHRNLRPRKPTKWIRMTAFLASNIFRLRLRPWLMLTRSVRSGIWGPYIRGRGSRKESENHRPILGHRSYLKTLMINAKMHPSPLDYDQRLLSRRPEVCRTAGHSVARHSMAHRSVHWPAQSWKVFPSVWEDFFLIHRANASN